MSLQRIVTHVKLDVSKVNSISLYKEATNKDQAKVKACITTVKQLAAGSRGPTLQGKRAGAAQQTGCHHSPPSLHPGRQPTQHSEGFCLILCQFRPAGCARGCQHAAGSSGCVLAQLCLAVSWHCIALALALAEEDFDCKMHCWQHGTVCFNGW